MAPCCPRATKFPEMCDMHLLRRRLLPDTQDPVRSPTTCGCFWCKFGVRDRTGSLCLGRLDGVRNAWNSFSSPALEAPESLLQCGDFCFRTTKNPLPAFAFILPSQKSRLPIKDPSNRLRPLQNSRQGLESRKVPNQPADALL